MNCLLLVLFKVYLAYPQSLNSKKPVSLVNVPRPTEHLRR
jgi:hypothetical protein